MGTAIGDGPCDTRQGPASESWGSSTLARAPATIGQFLVVLGVVSLPSCARPASQGEPLAPRDVEPVSLRLACVFHMKFKEITTGVPRSFSPAPLYLRYEGTLGTQVQDAVEWPVPTKYNLWSVEYYEHQDGRRRPPEVFRPEEWERQSKGKVTRHVLFMLRIGRFERKDNVVPVKLGPYSFDVYVFDTEGGVSVDERLAKFGGLRIRDLIEELEKPRYDSWFLWKASPGKEDLPRDR